MPYPYKPVLDLSDAEVQGQRIQACVMASNNRYFWLPCPLCGMYFGGHEWLAGPHAPHAASVHMPGIHECESKGICTPCMLAGRGDAGWPADWDGVNGSYSDKETQKESG
jgi:hypothetical protein